MMLFDIWFVCECVVMLIGMVVFVGLCWFYLWMGVGIGMLVWEMMIVVLFLYWLVDGMGSMDLFLLIVIVMWWVMMIVMMMFGVVLFVMLYWCVLW